MHPLLEERAVFVTMFPAVAAAVWFGGVRAGIVAAVLSGVAALYLFFEPRYTLQIANASAGVSLVLFLLSSGVFIAIAHHLRSSTSQSRNAEFLLQSMIDGLPALVGMIDRQYRYCIVNSEYSRWFGMTEPELLGKSVEEVIGRDAFLKLKPWLDQAFKGQEVSFRDYLPYLRGGPRWVQITYRPHVNAIRQIDCVVVLVQDISEQHNAQQALAEREREFRAMFELNATGSAAVDAATGKFILVNERFCEMTGCTCEELLEKTFTDVTHPEDRARDREMYRSALQSGARNFESEKRYVSKDGTVRWVMVRGTILRDENGKALRTLATIMDLTEWKQNQQALAESERRLRQALDAGQFGAWEWLILENRVIWSDRLYEIHGLTREAFTGDLEQFKSLIHPEDWDRVYGSISDTLERQVPYELEFRALRPDGETRWLWTTAQVYHEGGRPAKMVGITEDITERKKIELQLRESEERLRLAQRAAKVGTWNWELKENKISWSEGLFDLIGVSPQKGSPTIDEWMSYLPPEDRTKMVRAIPDLQRRGGPFQMEFRIIRPDGDVRWLLALGRTDHDGKGEPVRMLGVNVDITERKKAEELLQSQAQHLEELVRARTERLQEVILELESFSYTIAHDLRGPLRAMSGFAIALQDDYSPLLDELARDYIRRITGAAERMDRLICDVLNYSKITRQTFVPEPVPLDALIDGILETYPALSAGGAMITVERPLPTVMGSTSLLVQCFSNLIGNAVKFVPEGIAPRVIVRAEYRENGKVRIWVEDNGIGISSDNHERIFGLFQRLDTEFEGTGIGLAIVNRAAERMGGVVGLESGKAGGSRFWVELNPAPAAGAPQPKLVATANSENGFGR